MCNENFNLRLAPINNTLRQDLVKRFPEQEEYINDVYDVLTSNLSAQANLLVIFTLLKVQSDQKEKGVFSKFGNILYAPLSIVVKTGQHEWTRFRTKQVEELHTSFLSFMMAQENRTSLNEVLSKYNLAFATTHCCGLVFGDRKNLAQFLKSDLVKVRNKMRSYAESMAMPVEIEAVEDIPTINSDFGEAEKSLYQEYEEFFIGATQQKREDFIDLHKNVEWESILKEKSDIVYSKDKEMVQMRMLKRYRATSS